MAPRPALLIVGGLTVDRFPDGRRAAGGSVLHSSLAATAAGATAAVVTVAGDEPEARGGIARLLDVASGMRVEPSPRTTTYRHLERDGRRVLVLEARSDPLTADAVARAAGELGPPAVALVAPIADELGAQALAALGRVVAPSRSVLLIQGWLRRLVVGEAVHPLRLEAVDYRLWEAWGGAEAVVVSTEDIAEERADPFAQAAAIRAHLGPRPVLVLTLGAEGYLLDDPSAPAITATVPRRVIDDVPTVGAGDTFGAVYAVAVATGAAAAEAAAAATDAVIAMLEDRRDH